MRLRLSALAVGALLLVGCASKTPPTLPVDHGTSTQTATSTVPPPPPADFPVTAVPRPIVLFAPKLVTVRWAGSEQDKLSGGNGYRFTGVEPPTPGPAPVVLPDGPATFPLIGVRDALAAMSEGARGGEPTEIVGVELGAAAFTTDRGPLELPAWLFRSSFGSLFAWPAVTPDAFWKRGEVIAGSHHAKTSDGVRLEVELGAPETPCEGDEPSTKEAVVTETGTAVVVGVRTIGTVGDCARNAIYRPQYYPVTLAEPLGARLLVFADDNSVIPVTSS
ncbi:hypothetical protein LZG04_24265 [Saccharothrix sp. S26]|uniref:hypothetical protein n=1 Tax=Saccharothrix sp. S26 TaxID=2907215 RepID=UPI001F20C2C2|nr:hypothetical protein [Saccharothrix sp. S26]MCE6997889.1 hypothetical protein [Saccharothrix sp. S26]